MERNYSGVITKEDLKEAVNVASLSNKKQISTIQVQSFVDTVFKQAKSSSKLVMSLNEVKEVFKKDESKPYMMLLNHTINRGSAITSE